MGRCAVILCLLPFAAQAQSFDPDSFDTDSFSVLSFAMGEEAPPDPSDPIEGAVWTAYTASVPAGSLFRNGTAHAVTGEMYVTSCSPIGAYVGGIAHSGDGAMCIDTSGPVTQDQRGYGVNASGEVVSAECQGDLVTNGIPRRAADRFVCMSDANVSASASVWEPEGWSPDGWSPAGWQP